MKILVSACLMGENCKYNGGNNYSEKLHEFLKGHDVIMVCPEVMGGLPTPRLPSEIVGDRVVNSGGVDVTSEFIMGAKKALEYSSDADMAILQSRSPSCGTNEIYDGTFSGNKTKGDGIFVRMLKEKGIKVVDIKDL
ncbi:MAG: DUF523 domain-containing protein [Erysipelotrichaceae bacterium]|nr:DUF523 domain-containing protein [Erysipelotrichaceae bacterium]